MSDIFLNQENRLRDFLVALRSLVNVTKMGSNYVMSNQDQEEFFKEYIKGIVMPYLYSGPTFFSDLSGDNWGKFYQKIVGFSSFDEFLKDGYLESYRVRFREMPIEENLTAEQMVKFAIGMKAFVILILGVWVKILKMRVSKGKGIVSLVKS